MTARHALRRTSRLVAGLVAGALLLTGCDFDGAYDLPLPGSPVDADESFEVTAEFADVLNVVPRSPVMVDDVTVGEVVEVDRVGWHARVTLRVRDDVELPDNAVAEIRQVSLLGEKYVALEAPAGEPVGRLGDGDRIELPATGRNPEVEEVLGALSYLLSGGGVAQLGTITRELNEVMDGREQRLRGLLRNLSDVVGTLDRQKAEIIRAMESVAGLTETLNREEKVLTDALDATGPAVGVLREQHDELVAMLGSLEDLGDLLISFPFPKEASEIVKGDYANTSIRADISLENLLPGGGVLPPVEVPDPVETVGLVLQCLASGSLTSKPCSKVLADVDLLTQLKKKCRRPAHEEKAVCQVLNLLPDLPGLEDLGGLLGGGLDGLLDGLAGGAPSATGTSRPTLAELVGGGAA